MQESRKAQALSVIAILLVIFTLVLLAIVITVFITKPAFVAGLGFPNTMTSKIVDERNYENYKQEITCIYPYIKVGNECCLDKSFNGICDRDEQIKETTPSCTYPYIKINTECCLDDNNNGICDKNDIGRTRIRSSDIDSPFDINSIDIEKNEFNFDCDFNSRVNSDIEIEYIKIIGNETLTANGEIRADFNYGDY